MLACQGVDAIQYAECITEVVKVARPGDWIGLGGWCILGRWQRHWAPTFWATLATVLPRIAAAGIRHVHIFGVLWLPALGGLLWLADRYGIAVSTDSSAPLLSATWPDPRKAGLRGSNWEENVSWWQATLTSLRESHHYRPLAQGDVDRWRQLALPLASAG